MKMTNDGSAFVVGAFGYKVYIYHQNNQKFALSQTISSSSIYGVCMTSDGKWLATGDGNGAATLLKKGSNDFEHNQTIQVEDQKILSLFLTDDYQMLGIGT